MNYQIHPDNQVENSIDKKDISSVEISNWKTLIELAGLDRAKILSKNLNIHCKTKGLERVALISDPNGNDMHFIFDYLKTVGNIIYYESNSIIS